MFDELGSIFSSLFSFGTLIAVVIVVTVFLAIKIPMWYRRVVPTNQVHIVQASKTTTSYGKGMESGNTYYAWPSWVPYFGVTTSQFTLSVYSINLENYEAYDQGRLPFMVDIKGFFRISNSTQAAERVNTFQELNTQLQSILQGAVRSILAKNDLETILSERGTFGEQFTAEVSGQLVEWGCETVKNIEFMDIRDSMGSQVIANIMEKKKSLIEMQSRSEVANNNKQAEIAEINAMRETEIQRQQAEEAVGIRTAEKTKAIGIATEQSQQDIKSQAKVTAERDMDVKKVEQVRAADITKEVAVVKAKQDQEVKVVNAEADKRVLIVNAEGNKQSVVTNAEGNLAAAKFNAEGIKAVGEAEGAAETARLMAPVDTQITLAKEIGGNEGYQEYLIKIRMADVQQIVGIEQAKALQKAQVKVIANTGDASSGVKSVMELFTPKGGLSAGAALEAFANTEAGAGLLAKFGISVDDAKKMMDETPQKESPTRRNKDSV